MQKKLLTKGKKILLREQKKLRGLRQGELTGLGIEKQEPGWKGSYYIGR